MNLFTLDVETTMNAPDDMGKAHPMHPDNKVVLLGTKYAGTYFFYETDGLDLFTDDLGGVVSSDDLDFIVGCNISFDLCYLFPFAKTQLQKARLWDIQLAEYLLTAQQSKWPSLDQMAAKYGFPLKDKAVAEFFEKGFGADHVPPAMLKEYLQQDLDNTEGIARLQIIQAVDAGQLSLIISQMEALHCVTEMMWNGLAVDASYLREYSTEVANEFAMASDSLTRRTNDLHIFRELFPVTDIGSSLQWSKLFFGGDLKTIEKELVGIYKNGKNKYKNKEKITKTKGLVTDVVVQDDWKSEKTGKISVDEKVLTTINALTKNKTAKDLTTDLLKYRELSKQLSTYIQGLGKHVITVGDFAPSSWIFGRLNQVATSTGRLSSTQPNLQNISSNPIKKVFVSRYMEGALVEFDFQQLEVAILAHITGDPTLIGDIAGGKDIHTELYKDMHDGIEPDKDTRKWFKRLTFGLIYGAGARTLAENAGCSLDVSKRFMDTFYSRYPKVKDWHLEMTAKSEALGTHHMVLDKGTGLTTRSLSRQFVWQSETTRKYVFNEYPSTFRTDRDYSYSPTELKNYPVQGLATGDIVPMMLGVLFRSLIGKAGIKLVNTVHDSVMLDVPKDQIESTITEVKSILDNTHKYYQKTFGIPLALKLTAGVSVGPNWYDMEERK